MEKNECRRCNIPSRSIPIRARRSIPKDRSTPEARCPKKAWSPCPKQSSDEIPTPSSWATQNLDNRDLKSLSKIQPVLSNPPTDRGGRGGSRALMVFLEAGRQDFFGLWRHQIPRGLFLGWNHFCEPGRGKPTKLLKPGLAPKGAGVGFFTFPVFWDRWSDRLPFFDGLDLPSTRGPFFQQSWPPYH